MNDPNAFKVGDVVRILIDNPDSALVVRRDVGTIVSKDTIYYFVDFDDKGKWYIKSYHMILDSSPVPGGRPAPSGVHPPLTDFVVHTAFRARNSTLLLPGERFTTIRYDINTDTYDIDILGITGVPSERISSPTLAANCTVLSSPAQAVASMSGAVNPTYAGLPPLNPYSTPIPSGLSAPSSYGTISHFKSGAVLDLEQSDGKIHIRTAMKCECGSSSVGSGKHSSWCPLYE